MKLVVTIAALHSSLGGPARTVPALCQAIAAAGTEVELITISEGDASGPEAQDCRRGGLSQPIAVVPNGIDVPPSASRAARLNGRVRTVLFLSRLHPIKGLRDLVEAWARLRPAGWRMLIAGPEEDGHQREI